MAANAAEMYATQYVKKLAGGMGTGSTVGGHMIPACAAEFL